MEVQPERSHKDGLELFLRLPQDSDEVALPVGKNWQQFLASGAGRTASLLCPQDECFRRLEHRTLSRGL